ncbi:uncharacterized protein LOC143558843 [Bidens hawaiensis]|uniref:uncharacterized protein LOC143558843 n=1 Tax=Bidens hawaiensis TaxID=980011 RepID=UPI00404B5334
MMAAQNNEPNMSQYAKPTLEGYDNGVAPPEITENFEIKASTIHMVENSVQFHGPLDEDLLSHISRFLRICGTFKIQNCSENQIKLKLFPFSLRGQALEWIEFISSGSITTWDQMVEQFLLKYFSPDKTAKYRANITGFRTDDDESLHAAWERYKSLLRRCPHHGLSVWLQVQTFFDAQSSQNKQAIDQIAVGDLGSKSPNEAFEVLEKVAKKSFAYNPPRSTPAHKGIHHVDSNTLVTAQLEALSKKFEQLQAELSKTRLTCDTCGGNHKTSDCKQVIMDMEEVNFIARQNNSFSNNYNPGWRNHPNFSWKDGGNTQPLPGFEKRPMNQSFQPKPQFQDQSSSNHQNPSYSKIEEMLIQLITKTNEAEKKADSRAVDISRVLQKHEVDLKSQQASLWYLETQIEQIARQLSERSPDALPCNTITNPNAAANAVTLRSGTTTVASPTLEPVMEKESPEKTQERLIPTGTVQPNEPVRTYIPPIPYPGRLKQERLEAQYGKFLELFKQLHINIPFVEAIAQMLNYAKFLKEVLTNKRKLEELSHVTLSKECSAILQSKLPPKMTNPGSFTIPCLIGNLSVSNALADLGASINLMPYAVFSKLGIGEPKPTCMSI